MYQVEHLTKRSGITKINSKYNISNFIFNPERANNHQEEGRQNTHHLYKY
jgi:hypothetical protein